MEKQLSRAIIESIEEHVNRARLTGNILNVNRAAEAVSLAHSHESVAQDDIIEKMIRSAGPTVAIEFEGPAPARQILREKKVG